MTTGEEAGALAVARKYLVDGFGKDGYSIFHLQDLVALITREKNAVREEYDTAIENMAIQYPILKHRWEELKAAIRATSPQTKKDI